MFVNNPTTGINAVMNSLSLTEEDVILCTSHTYPAVLNTIDFSAKKWHAQIHSIPLKLPITSEEQLVNVSDMSLDWDAATAFVHGSSGRYVLVFPSNTCATY